MSRFHETPLLEGTGVGASNLTGASFVVVDVGNPFGFGLVADHEGGTSPTLDVDIETSMDGGTTWTVLDSFTQVTTTDTSEIIAPALPPGLLVRAVATFGGTSPDYNSVRVVALGAISLRPA